MQVLHQYAVDTRLSTNHRTCLSKQTNKQTNKQNPKNNHEYGNLVVPTKLCVKKNTSH